MMGLWLALVKPVCGQDVPFSPLLEATHSLQGQCQSEELLAMGLRREREGIHAVVTNDCEVGECPRI